MLCTLTLTGARALQSLGDRAETRWKQGAHKSTIESDSETGSLIGSACAIGVGRSVAAKGGPDDAFSV